MILDKYRNPPQAPLTFTASVESIHKDSKRICTNTQATLDKVSATITPEEATFDNVLCPILQDENERQLESNVLSIYKKVSTDTALREASAQAEKERSHFMIDCSTREDIFRLVDNIFQKNEALDPESRKLLVEERRNYIRSGLALSLQSEKDRLKEIQKRLSGIRTVFSKNLDEEEGEVWFTPEELAGVPDDVLSGFDRGTGMLAGKLKVTLKETDVSPLLSFALSSDTRREALTRRTESGKKNIPLFEEAINLRNEAARILGYANHANFRLEIKMAKTPEAVMKFLEDLKDRACRGKSEDIAKLLSTKQADLSSRGLPNEPEVYKWDMPYYTRLMTSREYSVDHQKFAEYFSLHPTVTAMLKLFGDLFGFVFIELKDEADRSRISPTGKASDLTWHPDVILYSVWNDDGEGDGFAGYLYLDMHPRPGKYGNAQCYPLQLGFSRPDGQRHYPSTVLITNFTKPTKDKPSLLKHSEMTMLFHELGHGMHDLSGRCKYSRFHGAETVGDFNEAPSQMLENWCWDPAGLKVLSSHYKTGEPLPDTMIDELIRTKNVNASLFLLAQLRMSLFDMAVHSAGGENGEIDVAEIYSQYVSLSGIKGPDDRHGYATYRHLFEGYDAGLYGYLWSNVNAMDMFDSVFKRDPMNGKEGRRYRHQLLEKGGSQDEMKTLVEFLGREPRSDAFFKGLGLVD